jgi:hypothetical protein
MYQSVSFPPNREELTKRKLLHNLHSSPNVISEQMWERRMGGACSTHREMRNSCKVLFVKTEEKRHKWEDRGVN